MRAPWKPRGSKTSSLIAPYDFQEDDDSVGGTRADRASLSRPGACGNIPEHSLTIAEASPRRGGSATPAPPLRRFSADSCCSTFSTALSPQHPYSIPLMRRVYSPRVHSTPETGVVTGWVPHWEIVAGSKQEMEFKELLRPGNTRHFSAELQTPSTL